MAVKTEVGCAKGEELEDVGTNSQRNAKIVGGTVSNKVAVIVQSSQPSSRPLAGRHEHIRKM